MLVESFRVVSERIEYWIDGRAGMERRRRIIFRDEENMRSCVECWKLRAVGIGLIATKQTTQKYSLEFIVPWESIRWNSLFFNLLLVRKFVFHEASRNDRV